jgi:DNA-damage-inducible protein D
MENQNSIVPFESQVIRKIWHDEQWYFSVVDIIYVLTDSPKPKTYWAMMKKRESQPFTNCEPLKLLASDDRLEGSFLRCINYSPSKNVFLWH